MTGSDGATGSDGVTGSALRRAAAGHAVVTDLLAPALDDADEHHLLRVRRLRDGDTVTVTDGLGAWRPTRLLLAGGSGRGRAGALLEPVGEIELDPPSPDVGVALALTKGDRTEQVVAQLTELGITRLVLLAARRSVVTWDPPTAARHRDRLGRIAREALGQCRGTRLLHIEGPVTLAELAARHDGAGSAGSLALAEPGGGPLTDRIAMLAVGPEGGWAPEERALGLAEVALPGSVLRAVTAAVVAGALLSARALP